MPTFDNLREAIEQEQAYREEHGEEGDLTALFTQLVERLEEQELLITNNPDLWERINFARTTATVDQTDWLQGLVDEANAYLNSLPTDVNKFKPSDDVFTDWFTLDTDLYDTTKDHSADLKALQDKAREELAWVPEGSYLYFDLANVEFMGWEDRQTIKDAIRRGKAYNPRRKGNPGGNRCTPCQNPKSGRSCSECPNLLGNTPGMTTGTFPNARKHFWHILNLGTSRGRSETD